MATETRNPAPMLVRYADENRMRLRIGARFAVIPKGASAVAYLPADDPATRDEQLALARRFAASGTLLKALETIESVLKGHPDFRNGNSKVHFCAHTATAAIAAAMEDGQ